MQASSSLGKLSFHNEGVLSKLIDQLLAGETRVETMLPNGSAALGLTDRGRQLLNSAPPTDSPPPAR